MITAVLIPFVPCSARIAVIFALSAAFTGPFWAVVVFAYVIFILALHGKVMSKFLSKPTGLILDIPRLQRPSLRGSMKATWLRTKDFSKSVFVCFANWKNFPVKNLRDEQNSILVSHVWDDIVDMVDSYLDVVDHKEMNFSIFEFESYKDAFEYCIDLRESF